MSGDHSRVVRTTGESGYTPRAVHVAIIAVTRGAGLGIGVLVSVLMANRFGASAQADAFVVARNLVLDGLEAVRRILLVQIVPLFVAAEKSGKVGRVVGLTIGSVLAAGCLVAVVIAGAAQLLMGALDVQSARAELLAELLPIFGLLVPIVLVMAVMGGVLMARRRFGRAELGMIAPRLALALTLVILVPPLGVTALAVAMVVGALAALLFVGIAVVRALRAGVEDRQPRVGSPAMVGGRSLAINGLVQGYGQLCLWLDYAFVALLPVGAFAVIDYSQRLMQLLPGVVSTSIATVLLTDMARRGADSGALPGLVARSAASGLAVVTPLAVMLAVLGHEIVQLLLGHGRFSPEAVDTTATLMVAFAPHVPIGLLMNVLFVALVTDAKGIRLKTVVIVYAIGLATRFCLLAQLTAWFGVVGVPVAGAAASFVLVAGLCLCFGAYGKAFMTRTFAGAVARIFLACATLASVLIGLRAVVPDAEGSRLLGLIHLGAAAGVGATVYVVVAWAVGVAEVRDAVRWGRARLAALSK